MRFVSLFFRTRNHGTHGSVTAKYSSHNYFWANKIWSDSWLLTVWFQNVEQVSPLGSMSEMVLFTDSQRKRNTTIHHALLARSQLLTALFTSRDFVASDLPSYTGQPLSTGGSPPRGNKWRELRDTPPCIPNDVTLSRIWKRLFWNDIIRLACAQLHYGVNQ